MISVGALTMGGAGKSPFVAHLAQKLAEAGRNPAILTRGYGRKSRLDVIVPRGGSAPVEQTGDEAQTYVRQAAAHVGIGADRYEVGRKMERELKPDVFSARRRIPAFSFAARSGYRVDRCAGSAGRRRFPSRPAA